MVAALWVGRCGFAEDAPAKPASGEIPSFFLREVTGPNPNLAKCLVCRYGDRPVVLLCVRDLDDASQALIEEIDHLVDKRRGEGLRGFAIFVDADAKTIQPQLFNLARDSKLSLPLTLPVEPAGPSGLGLSKTAAVSVILYRNLEEQRRFALNADEITAERIEEIVAAAVEMMKGERSPSER